MLSLQLHESSVLLLEEHKLCNPDSKARGQGLCESSTPDAGIPIQHGVLEPRSPD